MSILGMVLLSCLIALPEMRALTYRSDGMRFAFAQLNAEIESQRTRTFEQMAQDIEDATGDIHHTSKSVTQNNFTYTVDTYHEFMDASGKIIETAVVVAWTFSGRDQEITGKAIFTNDGLSDKKFAPTN